MIFSSPAAQSNDVGRVGRVALGRTGLTVSAVGAGAWQWGDRFYWGYGAQYREPDLRDAFRAAVEGGVTLFDTAEIYGFGSSERLLGGFVREGAGASVTPQLVVTTKFMPFPWRLRRTSLVRALRGSLRRLGGAPPTGPGDSLTPTTRAW